MRWAAMVIVMSVATQGATLAAAPVAPPEDAAKPISPEDQAIIGKAAEAARLTIRAQHCGASFFYTSQVNRRLTPGEMSGLSPGSQKELQRRIMDVGAATGRELFSKSSPPCDQTLSAFDARAAAAGLTAEEIRAAKERRP